MLKKCQFEIWVCACHTGPSVVNLPMTLCMLLWREDEMSDCVTVEHADKSESLINFSNQTLMLSVSTYRGEYKSTR